MRRLQKFNINLSVILLIFGLIASSAHAQRSTPVTVINDETNIVPVSAEITPRQPFQWEQMNVGFVDGSAATTSFLVPAGKRLVIEHVSGTALIDTEGEVVEFMVATTTNGMYARHRLLLSPIGNAGGFTKGYTVSQSMRLYADSNTDVVFYALRNLQGVGVMHVSISGYLLDLN